MSSQAILGVDQVGFPFSRQSIFAYIPSGLLIRMLVKLWDFICVVHMSWFALVRLGTLLWGSYSFRVLVCILSSMPMPTSGPGGGKYNTNDIATCSTQ